MYEYKAKVLRVIDGDSLEVLMDLGFSVHVKASLRLDGIDAPEINTPEGRASRAYLVETLPEGAWVVVTTRKDKTEKFGRMLAVVKKDGEDLNRTMLEKGLARPYDGGKR